MAPLLTVPSRRQYRSIAQILPGLLLVSVITYCILELARHPKVAHWGFGSLTLAIAGGILIGNTVYPRLQTYCDSGVRCAKQPLLRLGIVLYGLRVSFQQITALGITGILIDTLMLTSTFVLACWLGRTFFKLDRNTVFLIGAGSSICGAAAVLATAPVVKANDSAIAVAISTVVMFGTAGMFLYPWLYHINLAADVLPFSEQTFGVYIGSTVHEVAQVVVAGHGVSFAAENNAVIAKMLRVMMLAPFLLALGGYLKPRHADSGAGNIPLAFPWFTLGFVLVAAINSLAIIPAGVHPFLVELDNLLLTAAMAALGLTTHIGAIRRAGGKPILLALCLFIWLVSGGAAINLAVDALVGQVFR